MEGTSTQEKNRILDVSERNMNTTIKWSSPLVTKVFTFMKGDFELEYSDKRKTRQDTALFNALWEQDNQGNSHSRTMFEEFNNCEEYLVSCVSESTVDNFATKEGDDIVPASVGQCSMNGNNNNSAYPLLASVSEPSEEGIAQNKTSEHPLTSLPQHMKSTENSPLGYLTTLKNRLPKKSKVTNNRIQKYKTTSNNHRNSISKHNLENSDSSQKMFKLEEQIKISTIKDRSKLTNRYILRESPLRDRTSCPNIKCILCEK